MAPTIISGIGTGTILTVGSASGTIKEGMEITGTGVAPNTFILNSLSATTFRVTVAQLLSSRPLVATSNFIEPDSLTGFILNQTVEFKSAYFDVSDASGSMIAGNEYEIVSLGTTTESNWESLMTVVVTPEVGTIFTYNGSASVPGTGVVQQSNYASGIDLLGTVYFIRFFNAQYFTIQDQFGNPIVIDNAVTDTIRVVVGATPAVRVVTGIDHNFETNDFVRLDGIVGSTQLNNNTYYVHVITNQIVDLYFTPYLPGATASNNPVEQVNTYISGGYIWLDNLFAVLDTSTYSTSSETDRIYVHSTSNFISGTPVYFSQPGLSIGDVTIGNLVIGQRYYVKDVYEADDINVGSLIVNATYIIKTIGTTDFTILGAITNSIGEIFTATETGLFTAGDFVIGLSYRIIDVGNTDFPSIGAIIVNAGSFIIGRGYFISDPGTTDFTSIGAANNLPGTFFIATGIGTGTGTATYNIFTATGAGVGTGQAIQGTGIATTVPSFSISSERDGPILALTNGKGKAGVTQWQQDNVDRIWVTINGYRVPSSSLKLNQNNNLNILHTVQEGDEVIITSMIPTATPNEEIYLLSVDKLNEPSVYKSNVNSRTWITETVYPLADTIFVDDVSRIADRLIQTSVVPAAVSGRYTIGLYANRSLLANILVYNQSKSAIIDNEYYYTEVVDLSIDLKILTGAYIDEGDTLIITIYQGNLIYVNGEQIQFNSVNYDNNSISGLQRGSNTTGEQPIIPIYSEVYAIYPKDRMSNNNYNRPWNSYFYNTIEGDPLQISLTNAANFLR